MMCCAVPIDQVGRAAADAPTIRTLLKGLDDRRMIREAEIVVAAETQHGPTVDDGLRLLRTILHPPTPIEIRGAQARELGVQVRRLGHGRLDGTGAKKVKSCDGSPCLYRPGALDESEPTLCANRLKYLADSAPSRFDAPIRPL
jgi:hypothetical protein